jgi:hypothetical protein
VCSVCPVVRPRVPCVNVNTTDATTGATALCVPLPPFFLPGQELAKLFWSATRGSAGTPCCCPCLLHGACSNLRAMHFCAMAYLPTFTVT